MKFISDIGIAQWYIRKEQSSRDRGIKFELNLVSFRNLANAKKCFYTGLTIDKRTRTIDRVDNLKGYIKGNVVACHKDINQLKSILENPRNVLDIKLFKKVVLKLSKMEEMKE